MVSAISSKKRGGEFVVLLHAGESLAKQVVDWSCLRSNVDVQSVSLPPPAKLHVLTAGAAAVIIDATQHPETAMQTLGSVLDVMQSMETELKLCFYTEKMYNGLEAFVRLRGVLFLLGPMDPVEWDGFFGSVGTG